MGEGWRIEVMFASGTLVIHLDLEGSPGLPLPMAGPEVFLNKLVLLREPYSLSPTIVCKGIGIGPRDVLGEALI